MVFFPARQTSYKLQITQTNLAAFHRSHHGGLYRADTFAHLANVLWLDDHSLSCAVACGMSAMSLCTGTVEKSLDMIRTQTATSGHPKSVQNL